jgi:hypothetical protein
MIEIANRLAETTPAIIDRKCLSNLTYFVFRRVTQEDAYLGASPQTGRG